MTSRIEGIISIDVAMHKTSSDKLYPQCVELQWVGRSEPGERSFHMNAEMTEAMGRRLSDSVCQDTDEE